MIVELGGNDALRALPPDEMERNLDAIIDAARRPKASRCCSPACWRRPISAPDYGARVRRGVPAPRRKHDVPLYPFFLDGVAGDPDLNQRDGIHPSAAGIERIVDGIFPTVEDWLRGARTPAASATE